MSLLKAGLRADIEDSAKIIGFDSISMFDGYLLSNLGDCIFLYAAPSAVMNFLPFLRRFF